MKCYYTAVFERPDGTTFEQPYEHIQELERLTLDFKKGKIYLITIY